MRKKYLILLLVPLIISLTGCIRRKPTLISIETYELHCRNLSNDALIVEFYRVDVELQEALDDLRRWEMSQYSSQSAPDFSGYPSQSWYRKELARSASRAGTALGHRLAGKAILRRVKELRKQRAVVLTIIHQRELSPPASINR